MVECTEPLDILGVGLSSCPCVCHDVTNVFGCGCNLASCQYKVNLGQHKVKLPEKQLGMIKNNVI
jgi:hypothetical protein